MFPPDSAMTTASNAMQWAQQYSWTSFQTAMSIKRKVGDYNWRICETITPNPLSIPQGICYAVGFVFLLLAAAGEYVSLAFWVTSSDAYVGVSQQKVNYSKLNYDLLFDDGKWVYKSLNTINNNINNQHITMRDQLEARHTLMVNDINQNTVDSVNDLGCQIFLALDGTCTSRRRLDSNGKSKVEFDVTWQWEGEPVSFMEMVGHSVKMMIGDLKTQPRGKGNKKKPKPGTSGSQLFTNNEDNVDEGESGKHRGMMTVGYEALEEKLDEVYNSVADVKTDVADVKTDVVNTEGKMDVVETDIADMKGKVNAFKARMDRMEGKMDRIEGKMDRMEGKMDTIIGMMPQLLEQEKLVKESQTGSI